jgi:two-component system chemotaxis response regulator CheY
MRALVVDDSRTVRIIIGRILREIGMEVLEAGNGLDFVRAIRSQRAYDAVRILMVTSESESEQVTKALSAGANEYVMKPFNKDVLVAKLNLLDVIQE